MSTAFKSLIAFIITIIITGIYILAYISAQYEYEAKIAAEWHLADKSSTIPAKREHLDKFVANLEKQGLQGRYNALMFPTPDNSFDNNFAALKTLQLRLKEIETMDVRSFEYQTAIQQITQQEQGEASAMLSVFEGAWFLKHHFLMWGYVSTIISLFLLLLWVVFGFGTFFAWIEDF